MRRPHRNIEIFSMSVLDMFASALGAFIMIAVILFPYFNRKLQLDALTERVAAAERDIRTMEADNARRAVAIQRQQTELALAPSVTRAVTACQQANAECAATLARAFVVVGIEWDGIDDIDLSVQDPNGVLYDFINRHGRGLPVPGPNDTAQAFLSLDMRRGPGIEIWQTTSALPGRYTVTINNYNPASDEAVPVRSWIITRAGGRVDLPEVELSTTRSRIDVADFEVTADGLVLVRPRGDHSP